MEYLTTKVPIYIIQHVSRYHKNTRSCWKKSKSSPKSMKLVNLLDVYRLKILNLTINVIHILLPQQVTEIDSLLQLKKTFSKIGTSSISYTIHGNAYNTNGSELS